MKIKIIVNSIAHGF